MTAVGKNYFDRWTEYFKARTKDPFFVKELIGESLIVLDRQKPSKEAKITAIQNISQIFNNDVLVVLKAYAESRFPKGYVILPVLITENSAVWQVSYPSWGEMELEEKKVLYNLSVALVFDEYGKIVNFKISGTVYGYEEVEPSIPGLISGLTVAFLIDQVSGKVYIPDIQ